MDKFLSKQDQPATNYKFLAGLVLCFSLNFLTGSFIGAGWLHFSDKFDNLSKEYDELKIENSALKEVRKTNLL